MIVLQAEAIAYKKVDRYYKSPGGSVARSILAGMYIAFGGLFMGLLKSNGYSSLMSSAGFSLGLLLVVLANGELFTGNCLVKPFIEDEYTGSIASSMLLVNYIFNFIGICIIAIPIFYASSIDTTVFEDIAVAKTSFDSTMPSFMELLAKGFLCNVLVCLAIWMATYSGYCEDGLSKAIAIIFPITAFVFCGFEHCIANMFFLPFGVMAGKVTIFQALTQLFIVSIGNWFGGRCLGIFLRETIIGDKIDFIRNNHLDSDDGRNNLSNDCDSEDSL